VNLAPTLFLTGLARATGVVLTGAEQTCRFGYNLTAPRLRRSARPDSAAAPA
jgi:hypothetical protein